MPTPELLAAAAERAYARAGRAHLTARRSSSPPATRSSTSAPGGRSRLRRSRASRSTSPAARCLRRAEGLARQDPRRRSRRRPQHLARRPREGVAHARGAAATSAPEPLPRAPRRRSSTCRTTSRMRPTSTRGCARGSPSPTRRSARSTTLGRGLRDGRAAIDERAGCRHRRARGPARGAGRLATAACACAPPGCRAPTAPARRTTSASTRRRRRSTCRSCRRRRSARSRRPPRSAGTRARHDRGELSTAEYEELIRVEITAVIGLQEELGLDVLVHGEPERNDMVQYFAENLDGFAVTRNGWVQSYGSRATRPSILWGDVVAAGPDHGRVVRASRSRSPRSPSRACSPGP